MSFINNLRTKKPDAFYVRKRYKMETSNVRWNNLSWTFYAIKLSVVDVSQIPLKLFWSTAKIS